ncbi:TetR/AcrR family transcriptional regulator [Nitratireductor sp. GCM10026969]|uniref:TetR/AcrR family transcriptional regulator n=1 Tax=Nitratireductor sp. GCM10026969 TaxID=3252645 RepID=UPI003622E10F
MAERGRPRAFDRDEALRRAMVLFWQRGYDGASLGELTEVMGINRPSLYAAFGSKEALFREAVALYDAIEGAPIQEKIEQSPTARQAVEAVLRHNARAYVRTDVPRGCLVVLAALIGTPEHEDLRCFLKENRKGAEDYLCQRIARGISDGDVPATADPAAMAWFYTTVNQGLSIQAKDGASMEVLDSVVDAAMVAWDGLTAGTPSTKGTARAGQNNPSI